jgi:15-cis-phytoene synthase
VGRCGSVNPALFQELGEAERLAAMWARGRYRAAAGAVLALDGVLGRMARGAREPMLVQIRLAWWRDRIAAGAGTGHPVLEALADALPGRIAPLAALVDAWEGVAVASEKREAAAAALADARSQAMGLGVSEAVPPGFSPARIWSLVTLARQADAASERDRLLAAARGLPIEPLPRALRPLVLLDGLAAHCARRGETRLLGSRLSPLVAIRLGILGR